MPNGEGKEETTDDQSAGEATESDQETSEDQVTDESTGETTEDQSASEAFESDQETSEDQVMDESAAETTDDQGGVEEATDDRAAARAERGLPESIEELTDEQRHEYIGEPTVEVEPEDAEEVEVLAMQDTEEDSGEVIA
jgi:putative membrane protein